MNGWYLDDLVQNRKQKKKKNISAQKKEREKKTSPPSPFLELVATKNPAVFASAWIEPGTLPEKEERGGPRGARRRVPLGHWAYGTIDGGLVEDPRRKTANRVLADG